MAKVTSLGDLLVTCLQDLRKGEAETLDRFPAVIDAVRDPATRLAMQDRLSNARLRAEALDAVGAALNVDPMGDENIWMDGMLSDAEGDMKTEAPGPLLDLALIGAVRKMTGASLVSYETALAVAQRLQHSEAAAAFGEAQRQEREADEALRASLFAIAAAR